MKNYKYRLILYYIKYYGDRKKGYSYRYRNKY